MTGSEMMIITAIIANSFIVIGAVSKLFVFLASLHTRLTVIETTLEIKK